MGMYARLQQLEQEFAEHKKNCSNTRNHPGKVTVPVVADVSNEVADAVKQLGSGLDKSWEEIGLLADRLNKLVAEVTLQADELRRLESEKANRAGRKKGTS